MRDPHSRKTPEGAPRPGAPLQCGFPCAGLAVVIALGLAAGCSASAVAPRADATGVGVLVSPGPSACGEDRGPGAAQAQAANDPGPVIEWLRRFERQEPAVIAGEDPALGPYLRAAIERWPEVWQFHEHLAALDVRTGDLEAARAEHDEARRLYERAPLFDDPWLGWRGKFAIVGMGNTFAGPVGWLLGKGVVAAIDAMAGDEPVPFPPEPSAVAWSPPPTAHPLPAR